MRVVDPVYKMTIEEKDAAGSSEFGGEKHYFCSDACKAHFDKDPLKYLLSKSFIPPGE